MATATWLPNVLRLAGCEVVTHPGWETRSQGDFNPLRAVVLHHDGSPKGGSPGVPAYMIRNWNNASANCWVALDGTWHIIGAGVSYHAGKVLPGKPDNWTSLGVETDHTTGEAWPPAQLDSLRRGTAAILRYIGVGATGLEFHKTICSPPGRKTDPDGLNLQTERAAVAELLKGNLMRKYVVVDVPPPRADGAQVVGVPGVSFAKTAAVSIKANDDGRPVLATVQPVAYMDALLLSFVGFDVDAAGKPKPVPAGKVGIVLTLVP